MPPLNLFISYSHEDMPYKKRLETAFALQIRSGRIRLWDDQKIQAGSIWKKEILAQIGAADMIVLLISSDFFASDFIWNEELPLINQRFEQGKALVVPILLRPCDWGSTKYSQIQAVPTNSQTGKLTPISQWADKDEAWKIVTTHITQLLEKQQIAPDNQPNSTIDKPIIDMNQPNMLANEVKKRIGQGKIKEALNLLPDTNVVVLLKGRFSRLTHDETIGIISRSDANLERNRITHAILEMLPK